MNYFNKSETSNIERGEIYHFIFSIFELIAPSEIELLSKNIESIRLQIRNQLLKLISKDQIKSKARFSSKTKNEIRDAIIKADIKEALNILNRVSKSKEVALINFRYNEYLKNENLGIIGRNEKEIALNQIVFSILTIIDEMKELIDSRQTGIFSNEVKENIPIKLQRD